MSRRLRHHLQRTTVPPPALPRVALAALLGALAVPTPAAACSKAFTPFRLPTTATFVGAATADTVLAGAGAVRYTMAQGHHGPGYGQARPIHGQVVAVARLDARTRALLPAGTARVVIVPWDYGPDCAPTLWARSFRWAAPGATGLFVAVLRDRAHWAGGVPTLDVHEPSWFPYTGRVPGRSGPDDGAPPLSADELLGLYEVTPTGEEKRRDVEAATAPMLAWARRNPDLARREPAASALWSLRYDEEQRRVRAIASPLVGTWRLEASLDGDAPRTLWVRTMDRPTVGEPAPRTAPPDAAADPLAAHRSVAYGILLSADTTRAGLPDAADPYRLDGVGYLRVELPDGADATRTTWRGGVELAVLGRVFAADTALGAFVRAAHDESFAAYRAGRPRASAATFTRDADGALRVEQRVTLADGRTLVVRGERVSTAVIRDRSPFR